ncbi:MAG: hypothetical protein KDE27_19585 [Planctomycetes bacterium]|nr:hypothetical protein [Planctomycetota bacterium]
MRPILLLASVPLLLTVLPVERLRAQVPVSEPATADYTVHEWGTFTSMADPGGIVLEGLHHEEEALPAFVHDLMKVEETGVSRRTKAAASHVTQKMETPVLYFYAEAAMTAQVRVWFAQGLMTQFYPLPNEVFPRIAEGRKQRVDMAQVKGSFITWDIDVLPRSDESPAVPEVAADDPWHFARQTRSNLVRTRPVAGTKARAETEHYLFYRGLGRWQPGLESSAEPDGRLDFANRMAQPIPFCLALELGEHGGRFVVGDPLASEQRTTFELAAAEWLTDRDQFARRIGAIVLQALVAQGLFVDEARAMVATWSRSWFTTDGTRVIYLLPRDTIDQVLPLALDPAPKNLVRVMVGRHEVVTPAVQTEVEHALEQRDSTDPAARRAAAATFERLGRFLEPHLRNVARNGSSDAVRAAADAMLATATR